MQTLVSPAVAVSRPGDPLPTRVPCRGELAAATVAFIQSTRPYQADLRVVDLGEGPLVVKDFAAKSWWIRLLGRLLIAHEHRAYRWLAGQPGIPVLLGRVDAHALALEQVHGVHLTRAPNRFHHGEVHLERIRQIVKSFRQRRFLHLDLRSRRNVLARHSGEIVVVDLAATFWFRRHAWTYRLLERSLSWYYDTVLLKWKSLLTPRSLTEQDRAQLARVRTIRSLWVVNPKGYRRHVRLGSLTTPPRPSGERTPHG